MPKEFTWGPDREKSTATGRGTFFSATPQVCFWAYILIAHRKLITHTDYRSITNFFTILLNSYIFHFCLFRLYVLLLLSNDSYKLFNNRKGNK